MTYFKFATMFKSFWRMQPSAKLTVCYRKSPYFHWVNHSHFSWPNFGRIFHGYLQFPDQYPNIPCWSSQAPIRSISHHGLPFIVYPNYPNRSHRSCSRKVVSSFPWRWAAASTSSVKPVEIMWLDGKTMEKWYKLGRISILYIYTNVYIYI